MVLNGLKRKIKKKTFLCAGLVVIISGCAIVSDVTQVQKGVFTISSLGNMGQPGEELLNELYEKGNSFCSGKGLIFNLLDQQTNDGTFNGVSRPLAGTAPSSGGGFLGGFSGGLSIMAIPSGSYGGARIYFTCVPQKSPSSVGQ
jgi:hypothetical protein